MSLKSLSTSDRGATALLIAGAMMLIMGIAAVVIDGGFGFSERRQAQAGVDFGSLAALQAAVSCEAGGCTKPQSVNNGATEAMTVVGNNLPGRTLNWAACNDTSTRPAEFVRVSTLTDCVSFTFNFDKARVMLPDDAVATTFGRVLGFNSITVVAQAEAGTTIERSSDVIPHTPTGTSGVEGCMFSNQAPQSIPPCNGAASGFYGYLDIALYGKDNEDGSVNTPSTCNNGTSNDRISINMAKGGDHNLVVWNAGDTVVNDFATCPNTQEDINQVRVETGSPTNPLTNGLIHGISGSINGEPFSPEDGRLECPGPAACRSVRGTAIDNVPLWDFLVSGACSPPANTRAEMVDCLEDWDGTSVLFDESIRDSGRFAAIPLLLAPSGNQADPAPTGPGNYRIKDFIPIWIETLFMNCNADRCRTVHSPGADESDPTQYQASCPDDLELEPDTRACGFDHTSGNDDVQSMISFMLDLDMFPDSIKDSFPGRESVRNYALSK